MAIENDVNATQALSRVLRTFYYGTGNFVLGAAWSVAEMLRFLNQLKMRLSVGSRQVWHPQPEW
jgi:hypothetical protein